MLVMVLPFSTCFRSEKGKEMPAMKRNNGKMVS